MAGREVFALPFDYKAVVLHSAVALRAVRRRSCAAFGCGSSRVAASGGQGGPGGLRFPPRPSLDSPLPLKTPPLRYGAVAAGAGRCAAGAGLVAALRRRGVLSPGERERARRPSRASIEPGGVYAGFAAISSQGSLPPGEEIASYRERTAGRAACRPTSERVHFRPSDAVTWAKRSGRGACSPATLITSYRTGSSGWSRVCP